jgi:uncharacterized protein (TIGR02996 family)
VSDEETDFLRSYEERPDDLDVLAVYSDWLEEEESGSPRAEILRQHHRMCALISTADLRNIADPTQAKLIHHATRLLEVAEPMIGSGEQKAWLDRFTRAPVDNTKWMGIEGNQVTRRWRYGHGLLGKRSDRTSGQLFGLEPSENYPDSKWYQVGHALFHSLNAGYASYIGVRVDNRLFGMARNTTQRIWSWTMNRID